MQIKINLEINGEQIAYIFCHYRKMHGEFPKPLNGMHKAIRAFLSVRSAPSVDLINSVRDSNPLLFEESVGLTERYFPYSFE